MSRIYISDTGSNIDNSISNYCNVSSVVLFPQVLEDTVAGDDAAEDEAEQGAHHDRRDHPGAQSTIKIFGR